MTFALHRLTIHRTGATTETRLPDRRTIHPSDLANALA